MSDFDVLQRFIIENASVRGEIVHLQKSYLSAFQYNKYPIELKKILGEAMSAAALLSATIKFEGKLSLQLQGEGLVHFLLVQATHDQKIRGMLKWHGDVKNKNFRQLVGKPQFAITIEPDNGQRYQGIVPLEGETLSDSLEGYFLQSEQLPTKIWLTATDKESAGFMLQKLPGHEKEKIDDKWDHIAILSETITDEELLTLPNQEMLYRLYHGETVRVFDGQPVAFECVCSKERCEQAVISLGIKEIQKIIDEKKPVDMKCEFCGADYHLDMDDLDRLLGVAESSADQQQ